MALINPDTSKIPVWRRRPTRLEHPVRAWRCWGLMNDPAKDERGFYVEQLAWQGMHNWCLSSVAADCIWEGPVIRAHKRPVDPKYWDAKRKDKNATKDEYYEEMHDTFAIAGIHALKTREQAIDAAHGYSVSCYGEVALWGRIAKFELGYRAEVCMVKQLFLLPSVFHALNVANDERLIHAATTNLIADLSKRYDCEVVIDV